MRYLIALSLFFPLMGLQWDRSCQTGPGIPTCPHCREQDLDHDRDCDQDDYGLYQRGIAPAQPMVYIFVLDQNLLGAMAPEEYVRRALNQRFMERNR